MLRMMNLLTPRNFTFSVSLTDSFTYCCSHVDVCPFLQTIVNRSQVAVFGGGAQVRRCLHLVTINAKISRVVLVE